MWQRTVSMQICISAVLSVMLLSPLSAQSELAAHEGFGAVPLIGIGYVTNAPNMFLGFGAYTVTDVLGGMGMYVDAKFGTDSPANASDFLAEYTAEEVSEFPFQQREREEGDWWSVNAALIRRISPELLLYLGAGYSHEDVYVRFRNGDPDRELGPLGWYWVEDQAASGARINALGGAFFRLGRRVALQFGVESEPRGVTLGGSYMFSFR